MTAADRSDGHARRGAGGGAGDGDGVVELRVGSTVERFDLTNAWIVDPFEGREGPGEIVVRDGLLESVVWLEGDEADAARRDGAAPEGVVVAPAFLDLHAHFREPGFEDAETIGTGSAAAAHGGYSAVAIMPNTMPALDDPAVLDRIRSAALAGQSPVRVLAYGAVSVGRDGERLAALGELADAGAIGFSDDGAPVRSPRLLRDALLYAGMLGLPVVDHPEDLALTAGAEANDGLVASILGLQGWPAGAETAAVARDLAVLADVLHDEPSARLHLTHVSTAAALDIVRGAKARGLPVTCDVTPHHLALTDEWIAGSRRWSWEACTADGAASDPWADAVLVAAPYWSALRVNPPLRGPLDAAACLAALLDGTADCVATDHAPHTSVDKDVEFGIAANGISGIETALGVLLELVDAGLLPLAAAVGALTKGPASVLGGWRAASGFAAPRGLREGAPADLVVFDRSERWPVRPDTLLSKGKNSPLLGRELPGRVLLTIAGGRLAYGDMASD